MSMNNVIEHLFRLHDSSITELETCIVFESLFLGNYKTKKKELNEGKKRNNKEYRMMIMMTIMVITNRNNHFPRVFEHQATVHSLDIWLFSSIVALTLNNTGCAS